VNDTVKAVYSTPNAPNLRCKLAELVLGFAIGKFSSTMPQGLMKSRAWSCSDFAAYSGLVASRKAAATRLDVWEGKASAFGWRPNLA